MSRAPGRSELEADSPDAAAVAARVAHFYETLTPQSLGRLGDIYAADARFEDPFNAVVGKGAIRRVFEHMFATVDSPRFVVTTTIAQGTQAMLAWEFRLLLRGRETVIRGASLLQIDSSGRVAQHRDYWDAAGELYARLPVIGAIVRRLRRKLAAPGA